MQAKDLDKLRAVVIGAGYFGRLHASKLSAHPEVELAHEDLLEALGAPKKLRGRSAVAL